MTAENVDAVLWELLSALREAGVEFALVGGYAVVAWGIPRATYDVDVLVASSPEKLTGLFAACEKRGFAVDDSYKSGWLDRIREMPLVKVQLFRAGRPVTADVFLVSTPFQEAAFARRCRVEVAGVAESVPVISAADLILFKLLAGRPKDKLDVHNVLTVQGIPDPEYLREWARRLQIEAALDTALSEAGLS